MFNKNFFVISALVMVAGTYAVDFKKMIDTVKLASHGAEDACLSMKYWYGTSCKGSPYSYDGSVPNQPGSICLKDSWVTSIDYYCAADGYHIIQYKNPDCTGTGKDSFDPNGKCIKEGEYSFMYSCSMGGPCANFEKEHVMA